jgi:hypothetical protein
MRIGSDAYDLLRPRVAELRRRRYRAAIDRGSGDCRLDDVTTVDGLVPKMRRLPYVPCATPVRGWQSADLEMGLGKIRANLLPDALPVLMKRMAPA